MPFVREVLFLLCGFSFGMVFPKIWVWIRIKTVKKPFTEKEIENATVLVFQKLLEERRSGCDSPKNR